MQNDPVKYNYKGGDSRQQGSAPDLGRVNRAGTGGGRHPGMVRRKRRKKPSAEQRFRTRVWMFSLTAVTALGVTLAVLLALRHEREAPPAEEAGTAPAFLQPPPRLPVRIASPPAEVVLALVKETLAIRKPEVLAAKARLDGMTPEEGVEFLSKLPPRGSGVTDLEWVGAMDANDTPIEGVLVRYGASAGGDRIAMLTPDPDGKWRLDLSAYARRSSMSWEQLQNGEPVEALMRAYLAPDNYYNGEFSDERSWACYGLTSPDSSTLFMGYCEKGGPVHKALEAVTKDRRLGRAAVRVIRTGKVGSRQCRILSVVSEDWVISGARFDVKFGG